MAVLWGVQHIFSEKKLTGIIPVVLGGKVLEPKHTTDGGEREFRIIYVKNKAAKAGVRDGFE